MKNVNIFQNKNSIYLNTKMDSRSDLLRTTYALCTSLFSIISDFISGLTVFYENKKWVVVCWKIIKLYR